MQSDVFDEDYYERGLESGKSCYESYRWIPELTMALAMTIIDHLGIKRGQSILDYGCAKGYLVKAFRLLGRMAHGVDISEYAISHSNEYCSNINSILFLPEKPNFDFVIAKDVFEHIQPEELKMELIWIRYHSKNLFVIVPLGKNGQYNSPKNNLDITHVICEDETWWKEFFVYNGWKVEDCRFEIKGIKDSYEHTKKAHGFFILSSKS